MALWSGIVRISVAILLVGWYITGSATWGYESRWFNHRYILHKLRDPAPSKVWFTESDLLGYNGSNRKLPIYLAVDGMVFDVSSKPETYGPLGAYRFFSGKDAARAFATGCFQTDLTHDLRGLSPDELSSIKGWQNFFGNHARYWHIGYVHHEEPTGDPPAPCRAPKRPSN